MALTDHRKALGLTLAQTAAELGLSEKSVGWLSDIENGKRDASLRLALRIEAWSAGKVPAWSVSKELAAHRERLSANGDDAVVAPGADRGAEKSLAVFSPAEDAA